MGWREEPNGSPRVRQSLVHRLNGGTLISVTFIHDFIELTFEVTADDGRLIDTARLDCLVWPQVATADGDLSFGDVGYRDALCRCIGAAVVAVQDDSASGLQLQFPGRSLRIKPTLEELPGPEIAILRFFDSKEWDFWRPGEDAFADLA